MSEKNKRYEIENGGDVELYHDIKNDRYIVSISVSCSPYTLNHSNQFNNLGIKDFKNYLDFLSLIPIKLKFNIAEFEKNSNDIIMTKKFNSYEEANEFFGDGVKVVKQLDELNLDLKNLDYNNISLDFIGGGK